MIARDETYAKERRQEQEQRFKQQQEDMLMLIREMCNQTTTPMLCSADVCQKSGKFTHDQEGTV